MDHRQLEKLGGELRGTGHKRRQLVEQIYQEMSEGDQETSKELYEQLSTISDKAIEIMGRNCLMKK